MSDEELTTENFTNPYRYTDRSASVMALDSLCHGKKSTESLLRPATAFSSPAPRGRASTDALWKPGSSIAPKHSGFKAMSTPFLGFFKDSEPSKPKRTKPILNKHNYNPGDSTNTPAHVLEANNRRINGDAEYFVNSLKVAMMNLRFGESLPPESNHAVNVLLEMLEHTIRYEKDKDTEIEETRIEVARAIEIVKAEAKVAIESAKAETEAAFAMAKKNAEAWRKLEEEYKKQVKRLEIKLAAGEGGMEAVALSRSKSRLQEKRAGFHKTTSNLSSVVLCENNDAYRSNLSNYPKTSSNLSQLGTPKIDDEGGVDRQKSVGATTTSSKRQSNQVFDHKRTSAAPHDKLFADFGTLMDTQLSQSIQHHEDALAGAARQKWEAECRRRGYTGYISSPESPEDGAAGLGFELCDPELAEDDWKHKIQAPPRVVLGTATGGTKEVVVDEHNDDGADECVEIEEDRYLMKPKKSDGLGKRTKTFFGMNRKKAILTATEELGSYYSTSSSDTDDIYDDKHDSHNLANALFGMTSFATTIASPVPGMEQALGLQRTGLQILQVPALRSKNKRSATNLFGLVPDYKAGLKEKSAAKAGKPEKFQQLKAPIADYQSGGQHMLLLPEKSAHPKAPKSSENLPPSMWGKKVKGNSQPPIGGTNSIQSSPGRTTDQSDRNLSLAALSTKQGVFHGTLHGPPRRYYGSVKKRGPSQKLLETRSVSSLRLGYDKTLDAKDDDKKPAGSHFTSFTHLKNLSETRSTSSLHHSYTAMVGVDDDKTPTASHFTINRRHSYSDDEDNDNKSTYGKSNSLLAPDEQSRIISAAWRAPGSITMGSGVELGVHERPEARPNSSEALAGPLYHVGRFDQRASGAYSKLLPRGPSIDRLFDPRLVREPSQKLFENKDVNSASSPPHHEHTIIAKHVKSSEELKEEITAIDDASSHVLWRGFGHRFVDEEASWGKTRKLSDPFITIDAASEAHMKGPLNSSPPLTARTISEMPSPSHFKTVQTALVKSPEKLKEEGDSAETVSPRTLWHVSGHKFVGKEASWTTARELFDPFGPVNRASKRRRDSAPSHASPTTACGADEQPYEIRVQRISVGSAKSPEELKEESALVEATSRRALLRASEHTFVGVELSLGKQRKLSDQLGLIETPAEARKDFSLSPAPPLTARKVPCSFQEHGGPVVFPPRNDSLISARSFQEIRLELQESEAPTENDTMWDATELHSERGTIVPYWACPEVLKAKAHRDLKFAREPAADRDDDDNKKEDEKKKFEQEELAPKTDQLLATVTTSNTSTGRGPTFRPEDLIHTLHGHPVPVLSEGSQRRAIARLYASKVKIPDSITSGNRPHVADDRNAESRGASESSGEGQHTPDTSSEAIFKDSKPIKEAGDEAEPFPRLIVDRRPVTVIYEGHINGHEKSLPIASGDTSHSSPRMIAGWDSCAQSPESSGTCSEAKNEPLTSDRFKNEASEPWEQKQSSEQQLQVLKRPTVVTSASHERVASTSSVCGRVQLHQGHSSSPLLIAKHRRDGSSQSRGGRRDESTSSMGSLRSPANPALSRVQNDLMASRRGGAGQQIRAHTRNSSGVLPTGDQRLTRFGVARGNAAVRPFPMTPTLAGTVICDSSVHSDQLSGEKEEKAPTINPALAAARSVARAAEKKRLEEKQNEGERKK